ncbi:hypothetical protein Bbelb_292720 [Branchiostoma belcheri]|nr:hypothetical protein Bbelb_292720 [Branchiostoma belcheri]
MNVIATCEAAGMRYPCLYSGAAGCTHVHYWTDSCITYEDPVASCYTHKVLSSKMCDITLEQHCQPLDDTFVFWPGWLTGLGAFGVDFETHTIFPEGGTKDKYALCAEMLDCASSPCVRGTCTDGVPRYTCSCENGWGGTNCDKAQQVYLTKDYNWPFYKVLVTGSMTNENVKATCTAAGMGYPCYSSGTAGCTSYWTSGCMTYGRVSHSCYTMDVLALKLCGNADARFCQPLDDIFVYTHGNWGVDSALGMDYETHNLYEYLDGTLHNNKYALCVEMLDCASSPCVHGTCTDGVASYTCSCENGWGGTDCDQAQQIYLTTHYTWEFYKILATGRMTNATVKATCEAAGMRYPCYYTGSGLCTDNWASDCITHRSIDSCATYETLSSKLCGHTDAKYCQPLDDTFVYYPGLRNDDSAYGIDYDTHSSGLVGEYYNDMYALCAVATSCTSSPCAHGTCTDGVASYTCSCENGWEGTNCDQDYNECLSSPCAHGTCTDGVASYTCSCENGWRGINCDQDVEKLRLLQTVTLAGDQDIDECLSSPCAHGTCIDGVASYTCSCENGWTGNNCNQDIDECASNPCQLGGTCLDHVNGYSCVCPKETTGKDCETVTFVGDCYQFSTSAATHRDATQACSANSGRMVDLRDPQQQQFLANTIASSTGVSNWLAMKTAPLPILYSDGSPVLVGKLPLKIPRSSSDMGFVGGPHVIELESTAAKLLVFKSRDLDVLGSWFLDGR